ncbi:TetR/AcrR family transcriptional regulator [Desulfoscipio gibsoniae]|uniref:Transcriptional regulator n=1 Tax=Desulfoscipio gibsoniae DSM 7213 TaxID=767817 RepID=R4KL45_9FIRM|nr:TetR/AcrR family transcriptional regulator [Desulfoscipio gibsoniae]AGL02297.1 transcriptional regulator [Desulfoscipio gibsoniae DSM 7213]
MLQAFEKLSPDRQQAILNAAANVFAEEGYHFARISKICEKAGISNGALYKYFKDKEDLFLAVVDNCVYLLENELFSTMTVSRKSIFDSIGSFLTANVQFNKEYCDYLRIYCDLGSPSMGRFAANASKKIETMASRYTIKLIEESKSRGEINKNISNEAAAYLIDSFTTFFAYSLVCEYHSNRFDSFYSASGRRFSVDERMQIILDSLRQALNIII